MTRSNKHTGPARRWPRAAALTVLVLAVACAIAALVPVPDVAITPGSALDVATLVAFPRSGREAHRGKVLMVDVSLVSLSALDYVYYAMQPGVQIVPASAVQGSESTSTYVAQGSIDMAVAKQDAMYLALRHLGDHVRLVPSKVAVYEATGPSSGIIRAGEVIGSVGGEKTTSVGALQRALQGRRPGESVRVQLSGLERSAPRTVTVRLGERSPSGERCERVPEQRVPEERVPEERVPAGRGAHGLACLGVAVEALDRLAGLPFPLRIDDRGIIGPSAGLSFTLGLVETLAGLHLPRGAVVAATGTVAPDGAVGTVGGVEEKTLAVKNAGATVFFVPTANAAVARRFAGPHLRVVPVGTVREAFVALGALRR